MSEWSGSNRPIIANSMKLCCLQSVETYLRGGGDERDGAVVKCVMHPTNSDHRVALKDGRWRGKISLKPIASA